MTKEGYLKQLENKKLHLYDTNFLLESLLRIAKTTSEHHIKDFAITVVDAYRFNLEKRKKEMPKVPPKPPSIMY